MISGRKAKSSKYPIPRIITLGGDHTTTLCALESVYKRWGKVSVIHFDSHLDTWDPEVLGGGTTYSNINHGTVLHWAAKEGLIHNDSCIHAGIRGRLANKHFDLQHDRECGFEIVTARNIDTLGVKGIIDKLKQRVAGRKVYVSVDIDVLDPAFAPATGTPEVGGWSTRELLGIIDGLEGIDIVGADCVEVAPSYDTAGETTGIAGAEVVHSLIGLMVSKLVAR